MAPSCILPSAEKHRGIWLLHVSYYISQKCIFFITECLVLSEIKTFRHKVLGRNIPLQISSRHCFVTHRSICRKYTIEWKVKVCILYWSLVIDMNISQCNFDCQQVIAMTSISQQSYYHHQIGSIHLFHCYHIFSWLCVWDALTSYSVSYCICIPGKPGICFHYYCAVHDCK